jgi:hypothetical protein
VVRLYLTRPHELFADVHWKRKIHETVTMKMSQLASTDTKLDPAEPMGSHDNARPDRNLANDLRLYAFSHVLSSSS